MISRIHMPNECNVGGGLLAQKYLWFQQAIVGGPFPINNGDALNITCNFNV